MNALSDELDFAIEVSDPGAIRVPPGLGRAAGGGKRFGELTDSELRELAELYEDSVNEDRRTLAFLKAAQKVV